MVKKKKTAVKTTDGIDWKKYDEALASGQDAEEALKIAKE